MERNIQKISTRAVDKKGRILLGMDMADTTVLVERTSNGEFIVRPAVTVPVREAWLFQNEKALESVKRGLEDARAGRFVADPRRSKTRRSRKPKD